jgi:PqqD family protein of HPr-rel-A system
MSPAVTSGSSDSWRRDGELPFQKLDEETIVLDPRRREVHLLNETAARIWELLAAPRSLDELTAKLGDEYDVGEAELREAVRECVDGLTSKGLLVAVAR